MNSFYGNGGGGDNTEMISTLSANFAAPYNTTSTYSSGDFVIKDGVLYKANQDISIAEEWTAAHWTETAVTDEIGGGGDSDFFVVTVTHNWMAGTIKANCTWAELTATTKPIMLDGYIATKFPNMNNDAGSIAYVIPDGTAFGVSEGQYYTKEIVWSSSGTTVTERTYRSDFNKIYNSIAPTYVNYLTYNSGDLVFYQNTLYKCITAVTTPEDMDYTKWTAVTITDELGGSGDGGDNTVIYYVTQTYNSDNQTYGYTGLPARSDLIEAVGTASEGKNVILRIKLFESKAFYDFRLMHCMDDFSDYNIPGDIALWFETATGSHSLHMYKSGNDEIITMTQNPAKVNNDQLKGILNSLIAPSWQANTAYSVGDCVLYGMGSLYKCTEAHTSASYFQSGKWTETTLAAMIAAVNT